MVRGYRTLNIFSDVFLSSFLQDRIETVISLIEKEKENYILNVNEYDYVKYKYDEAFIEPLEILDSQVYVSSFEKLIPAERFSSSFFVEEGRSYKKDVFKFHIPFSGNDDLLKCIPNYRILWSAEVEVGNGEICFDIVNFYDDVESISREKDSILSRIIKQSENINSEVNQYNNQIRERIERALQYRKDKLFLKTMCYIL